jgi:DNA-binding SARP family transcriptional activator
MMNFEILGKVIARRDGSNLDLSPQQQLLLARLVWAKGAPVRKHELVRAVWDRGRSPDGGLKRLVYELRGVLPEVAPDVKAVASDGDTYQLHVSAEQVDAFRFAAKIEEASASEGADQARLTRDALGEWGPGATGLFGGQPLLGLDGGWATETRRLLRAQYRDAVIESLRRQAAKGQHEQVLRECAQLAFADRGDQDGTGQQDALHDVDFLELWMLAAYRCDQPERAEHVLRQATEAAERSARPVSPDLRRRVQRMRDGITGPGAGDAATVRPSSPGNERRAMSEPTSQIVNESGVTVHGGQFSLVKDSTIIIGASHPAGRARPAGEPARPGEPGPDDEGEQQDL